MNNLCVRPRTQKTPQSRGITPRLGVRAAAQEGNREDKKQILTREGYNIALDQPCHLPWGVGEKLGMELFSL